MDDIFIDAVAQFLKGEEWRTNVRTFVDSHCALFAESRRGTEYGHGLFEVWRSFQEMAEQCISGVLDQLGGTSEGFCKACDERLALPDTGPRDGAIKELLRQLLTFDNFPDFQEMMSCRYEELEQGLDGTAYAMPVGQRGGGGGGGGGGTGNGHGNDGGGSGGSGGGNGNYGGNYGGGNGDYGASNGDYGGGNGNYGAGGSADYGGTSSSSSSSSSSSAQPPSDLTDLERALVLSMEESDAFVPGGHDVVSAPSAPPPNPYGAEWNGDGRSAPLSEGGSWEAASIHDLEEELWQKEWGAQLAIAMSLLENQRTELVEPELVAWATTVLEVQNMVVVEGRHSLGVKAKLLDLQRLRLKVDLVVARRMTEENEQIRMEIERRRRAAQDDEGGGGEGKGGDGGGDGGEDGEGRNADELSLDEMLRRSEEVHEEITAARQGCLEYTPRCVSEETFMELYFFMKDKMNVTSVSQDGTTRSTVNVEADEIHRYVFSRISSDHVELVPCLLRLLVLESEADAVKKRVHEMMPQTPRGESVYAAAVTAANNAAAVSSTSALDEQRWRAQRGGDAAFADMEREAAGVATAAAIGGVAPDQHVSDAAKARLGAERKRMAEEVDAWERRKQMLEDEVRAAERLKAEAEAAAEAAAKRRAEAEHSERAAVERNAQERLRALQDAETDAATRKADAEAAARSAQRRQQEADDEHTKELDDRRDAQRLREEEHQRQVGSRREDNSRRLAQLEASLHIKRSAVVVGGAVLVVGSGGQEGEGGGAGEADFTGTIVAANPDGTVDVMGYDGVKRTGIPARRIRPHAGLVGSASPGGAGGADADDGDNRGTQRGTGSGADDGGEMKTGGIVGDILGLGSRVEANPPGAPHNGATVSGRVVHMHPDGSFDIMLDDGTVVHSVKLDHIRTWPRLVSELSEADRARYVVGRGEGACVIGGGARWEGREVRGMGPLFSYRQQYVWRCMCEGVGEYCWVSNARFVCVCRARFIFTYRR